MISHEELDHERFEELGALAALGQISGPEFTELQAHLTACISCRTEYADFVDLVHDKLPLMITPPGKSSGKLLGLLSRDKKHKKQFLVRAEQHGLHFSPEAKGRKRGRRVLGASWPSSLRYKYSFAIVVVFLFASVAVLGYWLQKSNERDASLITEVSKLSSWKEALQQKDNELSGNKTAPLVEPVRATEAGHRADSEANSSLQGELSQTHNDYIESQAHAKTLEEQLQAASSEVQALKAEVESGKNIGSQLESKLREAEASNARMDDELQKLRESRTGDDSTVAAQEARIRDLSEKLRVQTEALDRERKLLVAGHDIRDLMGARNLHIVDVYDVDGRGKSRRSFGRVFYTEGRSLIFYAFDLGDKKASLSKAAFQAWGYREATGRSAQSLGVFYVDDKNQSRWVLKFDDPEVLAQIDSVFVTVEPPGGSEKPTGQKLLYAFLNTKPNHP